jgi:hypothetical protein
MESIEPSKYLIKDSLVLHLNTQTTSSILLNGDYKSNILYDLKSYLDFENDESIEYVTCSMPYAVITNSNYIINEYNNTIKMFYNGTEQTFTIPIGNYIKSTFISEVNKIGSALPPNYFTITSSSITNKFTISTTALFQSLGYAPWGMNSGTTCDYIFGFRTSFLTSSNTFTMDRAYNFLPIPRFIFHCNILNNGVLLTNNSAVACSDVLASVPNSSKLNSQIIFENSQEEFLLKFKTPLTALNIKITDDDNRLINFNGISCYFDIRFNIYRKSLLKPLNFKRLLKNISETVRNENENIKIVD